ncbi:MAG: tRNA uridine-5-carboxymethylaminomethyl(34) synthesis GTPase MnmE, partial [Anaeroplasmataceae bacterium]
YVTNKVLEVLLKNGFELAQNGEFSKRAFLNGRIDLAQAESIIDLINANNDIALSSAIGNLRNRLSNMINVEKSKLLDIIANIEVNIDYPEYDDVEQLTSTIVLPKLNEVLSNLYKMSEHSNTSRILVNGIKTVILGKPNVGKSSLFNALIEEDKSIVTDIKGTTRDIVEGSIRLNNITLNILDTAGIRESDDIIEKIGINKSLDLINKADFILLVIDGSKPLDKFDYELIDKTKDKTRIIVSNKNDINLTNHQLSTISVSAKTKNGLDLLEDEIIKLFKIVNINSNNHSLNNPRHIALVSLSIKALENAIFEAKNNEFIDLVLIDIKNAYNYLGMITGEVSNDNLLNELFSKFCLGK